VTVDGGGIKNQSIIFLVYFYKKVFGNIMTNMFKEYLSLIVKGEKSMKAGIQKGYDYIEFWKESITDQNGNMPKRMIDDEAEEAEAVAEEAGEEELPSAGG
jgi:hypothetical protein